MGLFLSIMKKVTTILDEYNYMIPQIVEAEDFRCTACLKTLTQDEYARVLVEFPELVGMEFEGYKLILCDSCQKEVKLKVEQLRSANEL